MFGCVDCFLLIKGNFNCFDETLEATPFSVHFHALHCQTDHVEEESLFKLHLSPGGGAQRWRESATCDDN